MGIKEKSIMSLNRYILPAIVTGLFALPVSAAQRIAQEPGLSGFYSLGVGMVNVESNMLATSLGQDLGEDTIDNLFDEADSEINPIPLLGLSLTYTFSNEATEVFFGSGIEDLVRFDFSTRFGLRQSAGKAGLFELSALTTPLATEVWEDPYATGVSRDETDRTADGARIEWGFIFGSGLDLQVSTREVDIDKERSGDALVAAASITPGEQALLDRNGDINDVLLRYTWEFEPGRAVSIGARAFEEDLDGEAMSNDGTAVEFTYLERLGDQTNVAINLSAGTVDYDEVNPIYGEKDEADIAGFAATLFVRDAFGFKNWTSVTSFAFGEEDHEIDFYTSNAVLVSFSMLRRF